MTDIESRLRDAFRADAQIVRPEAIRRVPGRPASPPGPWTIGPLRPETVGPLRKMLVPLTAAASVAAIAIAATVFVPVLLSGQRGSPAGGGRTSGYPGTRLPIGLPRFFAGVARIYRTGAPYATVLNIYSSATGRVLAQVTPPSGYVQAVAALGNDRKFVAATTPGSFPKSARGCLTSLFYFGLDSAGQVDFETIPGGSRAPGFIGHSSLAASADGTTVSYATSNCGRNTGQLTVRHLRSGQTRTWTYRFPVNPRSMSMSADGSQVEMVTNPSRGCLCANPDADAARVLRTNSPPGPLAQRWRKVLGAPFGAAALSLTGTVTFAAVFSVTGRHRVTIGAYDTLDGRLIRVIRVFTKVQVLPPGLSANLSDDFALIYMLTSRDVEQLNLTTGRLRLLPVSGGDFPIDTAW